jgi:SAM-dependent methyltransferase
VAEAKGKNHLKQLLESNYGDLLLTAELSLVETWLSQIGGAEMLVTGVTSEPVIRLSDSSAAVHKTFVLESAAAEEFPVKSAVIGRADRLPFRSDSIDSMLCLHTLQQTHDPRRMVREVERVLKPEGRVIFSGLNPYSLAGLWSIGSRGRLLGRFPARQVVSRHKLCDWLLLLGLEIEKSRSFCYRPPLHGEKMLARLEFLERLGGRAWPFFGAGYLVQAQKHVSNLIPLAPARNWRSGLAPDGVITSFNRTCKK